MKKQLTPREKVLMIILVILMAICAYYYVFQLPTSQRIVALIAESATLDEQILTVDAQVAKMNEMKAELDAIESGEMGMVKEIPAFDNGSKVMNELSVILLGAESYTVNFSSVEEEGNTIRRHISLTYNCDSYESAKSILTQIHGSEYRNLIKDLSINDENAVTVEITYYEYKK